MRFWRLSKLAKTHGPIHEGFQRGADHLPGGTRKALNALVPAEGRVGEEPGSALPILHVALKTFSCLRSQASCRGPPISGTCVAQNGCDREVRSRGRVPLRRASRGGILSACLERPG